MSLTYEDLENNFPDSIDNFDRFLDPTLSAISVINQYYALFDSGNLVGATAILDANPDLKRMIINADNLNKLRDGILSLQRYYMNDVQQYLVELVKYKGVYSGSATYTKYDVVDYTIGVVTESYMGVSATIPIGTLPTNVTYFIKITLRGEQGISGTGLSYRGGWSSVTQYYLDDCVAWGNMLWSANLDNLSSEPTLINANWLMIMEIPRQTVKSDTQPVGQMVGDYWFEDASSDFNIQQKVKNSGGTYDNLYPKTKALNVSLNSGYTVEAKIALIENNVTNGMPTGGIIMWGGLITAIPATWALCDGSNGTPDLRNRFVIGAGSVYNIGDTGGSDGVVLSTAQLPSHQHGVGTLVSALAGNHGHSFNGSTNSAGSHNHALPTGGTEYSSGYGVQYSPNAPGYWAPTQYGSTVVYTETTGSHTHTVSGSIGSDGSHAHTLSGSTANIGSGLSHENRPPYLALAYIMKL